MTFLNKLNSARIGKIFARWPLVLAITSISLGDDWGHRVTEMWDKKKKTKTISFLKKADFFYFEGHYCVSCSVFLCHDGKK